MSSLGLSEKLHAQRNYVELWNKQLGESAASGGVHYLVIIMYEYRIYMLTPFGIHTKVTWT